MAQSQLHPTCGCYFLVSKFKHCDNSCLGENREESDTCLSCLGHTLSKLHFSCGAVICVFSNSGGKSCERKCLVKTFDFDGHICSYVAW